MGARTTPAARPSARGELGPEWPDGHFMLGRVALESGEPSRAVGHLNDALALDPASSTVLNELGGAYDRQENWQRALRFYERAARADPGDDVGRHNLVWGARWQRYGVLVATAVVLAVVATGAILLFGRAASWFVMIFVISGVVEAIRHRSEGRHAQPNRA